MTKQDLHIDQYVAPVHKRENPEDDVRAAVAEIAETERVEQMADRYGQDGVNEMLFWNDAIKQSGPNVAQKAGLYYATRPRPVAEPEEEPRNEDDHVASARAAFRQESKRQPAEQKATAIDGIRRLSQEHGNLGIIDTFGNWHQQFQQNPYDAAPRVAREIASTVNDSIGMQQAYEVRDDYLAKHQVSDEERKVMSRVLGNGVAYDHPTAHAIARYETAAEFEDPFTRDVVAAQRAVEASQVDAARLEVSDWDRRHPNVSKATRGRMRQLLASEKAQSLDEAFEQAKRR